MCERLKNELKNYRSYKQYANKLSEKLDLLWYELSGVKGVRYDLAKSGSTYHDNSKQYAVMEKIRAAEEELSRINKQLEYLDRVMSVLDESTEELVYEVFVKGKSIRSISKQKYISHQALSKRLNKMLKMAEKEAEKV